jgi:hypothetical protein
MNPVHRHRTVNVQSTCSRTTAHRFAAVPPAWFCPDTPGKEAASSNPGSLPAEACGSYCNSSTTDRPWLASSTRHGACTYVIRYPGTWPRPPRS